VSIKALIAIESPFLANQIDKIRLSYSLPNNWDKSKDNKLIHVLPKEKSSPRHGHFLTGFPTSI
jgi:hypothetical protein